MIKKEVTLPDHYAKMLEFIFGCPCDEIPKRLEDELIAQGLTTSAFVSYFTIKSMIRYYPEVDLLYDIFTSNDEYGKTCMMLDRDIYPSSVSVEDASLLSATLNGDSVSFIFTDNVGEKLKLRLHRTVNHYPLDAVIAWCVKNGYYSPEFSKFDLSYHMAVNFLCEQRYDEGVVNGLCDLTFHEENKFIELVHYCQDANAIDILADIMHRYNVFKNQKKVYGGMHNYTFRL